jgi:sterol desaturase/sphingolipid hydroxylase (fatty acid hydroxylase superfamily)
MDWLGNGVAWAAERLGGALLSPGSRIGVLAAIAGWVIGAFAFAHYHGSENFSVRAYLRHAFPKRVYWSRTFAVDAQVLAFTLLAAPLRWTAKIVSVTLIATVLAGGLEGMFGPVRAEAPGAPGLVLLGVLLFLAYDLGTYLTHRLSHMIPALWAFHRVHHSAEELNPLTLTRKHPVYSLLSVAIDCVTVAPLQALVLYGFGASANIAALGFANIGFVAFVYAASTLRHTHIWLSFGPVLDRVVVSPALHQIHHSRAPRHFDRNFGEMLSLWDWLFGTLYLPRQREELSFGLAGEERQPHPTLATALLEPFGYAWRALRKPRPRIEAPITEAEVAPVPDQTA